MKGVINMKKIPTLFQKQFDEKGKFIGITDQVTPGCEWVLYGGGTATIKIDGAACAFIEGIFYKRYDAKNGKTPPEHSIPCDDPDAITGHWPHWVPVDPTDKADQWFCKALHNTLERKDWSSGMVDGTYEAIGPHFNGNPHNLPMDYLQKHGTEIVELPDRSYEGIRNWLETHEQEGLVFWRDGEPRCKIRRKDFGFKWPVKGGDTNGKPNR
jgi:hypothetical protein